MAKEKKKSDWDDLQDLLSSSEVANDWDDAPNADAEQTSNVEETATVAQEESNEFDGSSADAQVAKKSIVKGKKTSTGDKKAKSVKSRKKASAKKTDAIAVALEHSTNETVSPTETETLDVAVGDVEDDSKKRRRSTAKKAELDENDLVKNVLKLEKETKAKKRARAKESPFVGLLSQIDRIAEPEEADAPQSEPTFDAPQSSVEKDVEIDAAPVETFEVKSTKSDSFSFENFFDDDSSVEELDISWGKPIRAESVTSESAPKTESNAEPQPVEAVAEADVVSENDDFRSERRPRRDDRDRRKNRRDRDSRRRRDENERDDDVQKTPIQDEAPVAVDLNNLEAFFGTPSDEIGFGFSPRRDQKSAVAEKAPDKREKFGNVEKFEFEEKTPEENDEKRTFRGAAPENDENDDRARRNKRRRRRNDRREFDVDSSRAFGEERIEERCEEKVEDVGPKIERDAEGEVASERREQRRDERRREERDDEGRSRRRDRERRPRREFADDGANVEFNAKTVDSGADVENAPADRRAETPQRILPSWGDAISYVVRFNMGRRTNNRRKN